MPRCYRPLTTKWSVFRYLGIGTFVVLRRYAEQMPIKRYIVKYLTSCYMYFLPLNCVINSRINRSAFYYHYPQKVSTLRKFSTHRKQCYIIFEENNNVPEPNSDVFPLFLKIKKKLKTLMRRFSL